MDNNSNDAISLTVKIKNGIIVERLSGSTWHIESASCIIAIVVASNL